MLRSPGASFSILIQSVDHLNTIEKTRYPNMDWKKSIPGMKLAQMSIGDLKCRALMKERDREYVMWHHPIKIPSFILKLLANKSSFSVPCHIQSSPNGYR